MSNTNGRLLTEKHDTCQSTPHRGLTLIEMLIGMAITLLMMAAVVTLFANIGSGVRIRQATIEMSAKLRTVRTTLYNDLTHATCRTVPWQRPDEDPGYLEIVEGKYSDIKPSKLVNGDSVDGEINYQISQIPSSQAPNTGNITDGSGLGDYDDIIALTVRQESAPFSGEYFDPSGTDPSGKQVVESSVAEVIWFAVENDGDQPEDQFEELGMRKLYRRQLIVAPWANLEFFNNPVNNLRPNPTNFATLIQSYKDYYSLSDVSVRIELTNPNDPNSAIWVPNTLGDLAKRENRFGHYYFPDISIANGFPHRFPYYEVAPNDPNFFNIRAGDPDSSLQPIDPNSAKFDEDLALENVLAFDVLVFDPGAPLFEFQGDVIEPSSGTAFQTTSNGGVIDPANLVGFGAYVDLGWDDDRDYNPDDPMDVLSDPNSDNYPPGNYNSYYSTSINGLPEAHFQEEHRVGWHPRFPLLNRSVPAVYDTWSLHYEYDGINQADYLGQILVDEGTNGLDDDRSNGVDDVGYRTIDDGGNLVIFPGERETSPPYDVPLRSVRVKLRIYEPDTRQTREVSVTASFVPQ